MDAVRDYVPLGELEAGTVLHVQGGGEAILVSKTWRQGDFVAERSDVGECPERSGRTVRGFDFEVGGLHNFYVRGPGSHAAGVLVHNSTGAKRTESFFKAPAAGRASTSSTTTFCRRTSLDRGVRVLAILMGAATSRGTRASRTRTQSTTERACWR